MHQVVARLDSLDPEAGAAVRVIARFDALVEGRAGLAPILTAVAVLTGTAARLVDEHFDVALRAEVDGRVERPLGAADPQWCSAPLTPDGPPVFWLERVGAHTLLDAMVLDRAAFAAREVLRRTRRGHRAGPLEPTEDDAAVEVLLDGRANPDDRRHAARLLSLTEQTAVRAVATCDGPGRIMLPAEDGGNLHGLITARQLKGPARTGVGPAVPVLELPTSWAEARTALRFASAGTDHDPGPSTVYAEELGALAIFARSLDPAAPPDDVRALELAAHSGPWVLRTLAEFTSHSSLRLAAAALYIHHSTLTDRLTAIEHELGFPVRTPQGRLRIQLALVVRRLLLHPDDGR
ncbi:helix-turn-helix domain-containing protein [Streptomyces lunalinharesii]|uniref:Helix-turn-helix domain-containing protein n=1 Tax=Streptomyces lunalinharesii TaxID=333384 RepID=A0ABN3S3N2_9ACTN